MKTFTKFLVCLLIAPFAASLTLYAEDEIPNDEIWYTSVNGTTVVPNPQATFGANIISNTNENGKGIIKFDTDVTCIGKNAFSNTNSYHLTSIIIPNSVTDIEADAFYENPCLDSVFLGNSLVNIKARAFCDCPNLSLVIFKDSVKNIGNHAFSSCPQLVSVDLPNSVETIGRGAFQYCTSLSSISIPESVIKMEDDVFSGCSKLPIENNIRYADTYLVEATDKTLSKYIIKEDTHWLGSNAFIDCSNCDSVVLPKAVRNIGEYAFTNCSHLTSIIIGDSVQSIGNYAFKKCSALKNINIPNSVISMGRNVFEDCLSLPIDNNLRYADTYLVEATDKTLNTYLIKKGTKWIGDNAFNNCSEMTHIDIPTTVVEFGMNAFVSCSKLDSIMIPNSVTNILDCAFWYCSSLESIDIPNSVTYIADGAYGGCSNLRRINVIPGNTIYDSRENCNAIIETSTNRLIVGCQNTIIPKTISCIGKRAFHYCDSLSSIVFPDSLKTIEGFAFYYCMKLHSIKIPKSVESIGSYAFSPTNSIRMAKIVGYTYLQEIYVSWDTPITVNRSAFTALNSGSIPITLYVPQGMKETYMTANVWKDFSNIVEITPTEIESLDCNSQLSSSDSQAIFNISGQRITSSPKGRIHIQNGKKLMAR